MPGPVLGIHHVTAICRDAQTNLDFYVGLLGLRLVKLTVNFDDPGVYHLYYGDRLGTPGSILTFFPYPGGHSSRPGNGQFISATLKVPSGSLAYWAQRLASHGIEFREEGAELVFADPDDLEIRLVEASTGRLTPWAGGPVEAAHAAFGIAGVTLSEEATDQTRKLLGERMGLAESEIDVTRRRFSAGETYVDLVCRPDAPQGRGGPGSIHHVAFRVAGDPEQEDWRKTLVADGYNVSPVMDRNYFHSIYYREPGGALFEIATDTPGFTADEAEDTLGQALKLPSQYEPYRDRIEAVLPALKRP